MRILGKGRDETRGGVEDNRPLFCDRKNHTHNFYSRTAVFLVLFLYKTKKRVKQDAPAEESCNGSDLLQEDMIEREGGSGKGPPSKMSLFVRRYLQLPLDLSIRCRPTFVGVCTAVVKL